MRLLFCKACSDIVCIRKTPRTCECGQSGGFYNEDGLHVVISGPCVALGFNNRHFRFARDNEGFDFNAWFIKSDCPTVKRVTPKVLG